MEWWKDTTHVRVALHRSKEQRRCQHTFRDEVRLAVEPAPLDGR
jgi:hypothetical protein